MNIVSIDGLSKTMRDEPLFENVTFGIETLNKIGFVGKNGAGKSTFLKILTGEIVPDSGVISKNKDLLVSFLEQKPLFSSNANLIDFFYESNDPKVALIKKYNALLHDHVDTKDHHIKFEKLTHEMEKQEAFNVMHTYESFLSELGLTDFSASMNTFSGGMIKKAAIARCFAIKPDLLLLDEPTNHLDIDTIEWLEKKLKNANFAFILVTHDRYFLDSACNEIMEIDNSCIYKYEGDYSEYLKRKATRMEISVKAAQKRESILRVELEWLRRGPKARAGKSKSRKDKISGLLSERNTNERGMDSFSQAERRLGGKVLELNEIGLSYGNHTVIKPFSYKLTKGDRIGIIGPNGSGKTSLLELIMEQVKPTTGNLIHGETAVFGYFDQHAKSIDKDISVLDYIRESSEQITMKDGYSLSSEQFLERFMFPRTRFMQKASKLSGGELRRLQLIKLLASNPNVILLDEPTNDFDIETISLLEDFLDGFTGCILTVSHDRAFLDMIVDKLFVMDGSGSVIEVIGGYGDYREALLLKEQVETLKPAQVQNKAVPQAEKETVKVKKLSFKEQKEFDGLLDEIEALETEKNEIEAKFSTISAGLEMQNLTNRYNDVISLIDTKTSRWEELSMRGGT